MCCTACYYLSDDLSMIDFEQDDTEPQTQEELERRLKKLEKVRPAEYRTENVMEAPKKTGG